MLLFFIESNEVESLRVHIRRLEDKVGGLLHFRILAFLGSLTSSLFVLGEQTSRFRNTSCFIKLLNNNMYSSVWVKNTVKHILFIVFTLCFCFIVFI